MEFFKKVTARARNMFPPKSDISEVVDFVKGQKIPGEIIIHFPGNGGITSIEFAEKEKVLDTVQEK